MNVPGFDRRTGRSITFGREMIKAALLAAAVTYYSAGRWEIDWLAVYGILIWAGIAIAWAARSFGGANVWRLPEGPPWRKQVVILFLVSLVLAIRYDECPHATYLKVGPFSFVLEGRACGNVRDYKSVLGMIWSGLRGS
jgi:hypothetical protein